MYAAVNKSWFWKISLNSTWKLLSLASSYSDLDWADVSEMDSPWSSQSNLSVVAKTTVAESTCSALLPVVIHPRQRGACFGASPSLLRLCCPCLKSGWICSTVAAWAQVMWKHSQWLKSVLLNQFKAPLPPCSSLWNVTLLPYGQLAAGCVGCDKTHVETQLAVLYSERVLA